MSTKGIAALIEERVENVIRRNKRTIDYDVTHNPNGELLAAAKAMILEDKSLWPTSWYQDTYDKLMARTENEKLIIIASFLTSEFDRRIEDEVRRKHREPGKSFDAAREQKPQTIDESHPIVEETPPQENTNNEEKIDDTTTEDNNNSSNESSSDAGTGSDSDK